MNTTLYTTIKDRLLSIEGIQYVALWNNQYKNEGQEKAIPFPNVLVEFTDWRYTDLSQGVQRFSGTLRLHIGLTTWKPEDDLAILDTVEAVSASIHGYTPEFCAPFSRIKEQMDASHGALVDWVLDFKAAGTATNSYRENGLQSAPAALDLAGGLVITNTTLRTADGI